MRDLAIRILSVLGAVAAFAVTPAWAQSLPGGPEHPERPVVVELFSSQSCGNCPVANKNVAELARRTDVIALTYPVGLWDYLGWDDTFAKPEFTERQKAYNRALGHRGPYTPQIVFSGRVHSPGVKLDQINDRIASRDVTPYPVKVTFTDETAQLSGPATGHGMVMLIRIRPGSTTMTPKGGANQGRTMTYYNLVTSVEEIGRWSGGAATYATRDCKAGCTILVQEDGATGKVIGALQRR
jgi:hypothetical protein